MHQKWNSAGFIVTLTTVFSSGCALAQQDVPVTDLRPAPRTPQEAAKLIAPKNFTPSGRGAAYDRTALFVSKGRFPLAEAWLGRELPYFSYFTPRLSPQLMVEGARKDIVGSAVLQPIKNRVKLCVMVPLAFPTKDGLKNAKTPAGVIAVRGYLADTAAGKHDEHFRGVGRAFIDAGFPDAIVRLGHEFSGRWYPWSAVENPDAYAKAFRHVAGVLRSVSPDFTFDFNGSSQDFDKWAAKAYPGDDYVDIISTDIYDRGLGRKYFSAEKKGWADPERAWREGFLPRLEAVKTLAIARGKMISLPEWGIEGDVETGDGTEGVMVGGGDNPTFLRNLAAWLDALPTSGPGALAYQSYFWAQPNNEGVHEFDQLPKAAAAFLELFGNPDKSNGKIPPFVPATTAPAPKAPANAPKAPANAPKAPANAPKAPAKPAA